MPGTVSGYFLRRVPEQAAGCVHSTFHTSFNVSVGGFLVHVGTVQSPLSCLGFNIAPGRMEELLPFIRPGDRAVFRAGTLRIYDRQNVSVIPYGGLKVADLQAGPSASLPGPALHQALLRMGLPGRIGLAYDSALCRALEILREHGGDRDALREAVSFLLGRGRGLTPSGDDILMGYGAGLWAWGESEPLCCALRGTLRRQTTDISAAYLNAILDGYVNEDYKALFSAVRAGREEEYDRLLEQISCHGHTSGCDGLLGLLTAIEMLNRPAQGA